MVKRKKSTNEVAAPKVKTTTHTIIKAGLGHNLSDKVELGTKGVQFYRKLQLIK